MKKLFLFFLVLLAFSACKNLSKEENETYRTKADIKPPKTDIDSSSFSISINNKKVNLYYLQNKNGMSAYFTNYGGRLISLMVPDREGNDIDVVVGLKSAKAYKESTEPYFGATIGRYGNRIAQGKFSLKGKEYEIPVNNGKNALHGGEGGFHNVVWNANQPNDHTLIFNYLSNHLEEGFPGNLEVKVTYSLLEDNSLKIQYEATTDRTTPINLTNHAFFNLNGEGSGTVENHILQINADAYTPVDSTLIPTGEISLVDGSPFDFKTPKSIGKDINSKNKQLEYGKGYDHNFVLNGVKKRGLNYAARVVGDESEIVMKIFTTEPGLQFYSGNFMQGKNELKSGKKDEFRNAFCLETQHFPDSPNHPEFPSTILEPGQLYSSTSIYNFDIKK